MGVLVLVGAFARKISLLWSLVTPCVRIEDRNGLCTVASALWGVAGYSIRFRGGWVISPGARIPFHFLKIRGGFMISAAGFFELDGVLGCLFLFRNICLQSGNYLLSSIAVR
jgi:hypothetical protein